MEADLKNFGSKGGVRFVQDSIETLREVKIKDSRDVFYVLKYESEKGMPETAREKYSEVGTKETEDKAMDRESFDLFLKENEEAQEEEIEIKSDEEIKKK